MNNSKNSKRRQQHTVASPNKEASFKVVKWNSENSSYHQMVYGTIINGQVPEAIPFLLHVHVLCVGRTLPVSKQVPI